ncbi:hypothetical protein ONE63_011244 [Megalurothrips usitatus]|uniref:C2H2-type domain-containing protein n=1 Tax=Megalurothrips usitatus TaxID=439358 RepID=A0AAV7X671_9NEOP|nr:hypothetical protein ONE63_011244 [Megalurothrips usitatus]
MAEASPSWAEFQDFKALVKGHDEQLRWHGYLLINPPDEWLESMANAERINDLMQRQVDFQQCVFKANDDRSGFTIYRSCSALETVAQFRERNSSTNHIGDHESFFMGLGELQAELGVSRTSTMFPDDVKVWNMNHLGDPVSSIQRKEGEVPGITSPLLSIGSLGAPIGLQTEAHDLYLLSYIHEGEPRDWSAYKGRALSKGDKSRLELVIVFYLEGRHNISSHIPNMHESCPTGFNVASSISFGMREWTVRIADSAQCSGDCGKRSTDEHEISASNSLHVEIPQEDPFEFTEEAVPRPKLGRPRDPKKNESAAARPTKLCPECRSIHDKNFNRHLNLHYDISTVEGRRKKERALSQATARTVQGLRNSKMELLPASFVQELKTDHLARYTFQTFLDDVGVKYPRETEEPAPATERQGRSEDADHTEGVVTAPTTGEKSAKKKMQELGYSLLDAETTIIKALKEYGCAGDRNRKDLIQNAILPVRRLLGYVEYISGETDAHGWGLLLKTENMKEYIRIMRDNGGASASTAKNYVDKILNVFKLTDEVFFDRQGIPAEPVAEKLKDLALKRTAMADAMPDIASWEEYATDKDNLIMFDNHLAQIERASIRAIRDLQHNPAKSSLREAFNYVVEFIATRQLFLAARPGELSRCTYEEITRAKSFREALHIHVAGHKTGRIKQAAIRIEKGDQETFLRYVAILKRFNPLPTLGFPFLSPTKGFVEHTNIYRRLNLWLQKKDRERFTSTKLRKTVETTTSMYGTERQKALVASALQHSQSTVKRHYNLPTNEMIAMEKAAVEQAKAESKLRYLFEQRQFETDIHQGPMTQDQLTSWAKAEMASEHLAVSHELYSVYLTNWGDTAKPLMLQACKSALQDGAPIEEIETVLSSEVYRMMKADIMMDLRHTTEACDN